jgi:hypothetical protein
VSSKTSWWYYSCQEKHFNIKFAIFSWHLAKSNKFFFCFLFFNDSLILIFKYKSSKNKNKNKNYGGKICQKGTQQTKKKKELFFLSHYQF